MGNALTLLQPDYGRLYLSGGATLHGATMAKEPPRIWALLSDRVGDNAQVIALMEALRLPYEIKTFSNRAGAILANLLFGPKLSWMIKAAADTVEAPWPHLVIASGTQSEPICSLIRRRAKQDGHDVRFVFLGRPWELPSTYDLIVTTPQYKVPAAPNVMQIDFPLHRVTNDELRRGASAWAFRLAHLPRPYIAVIVGGGSIGRYTFDDYAVRRLARQADELALSIGGSLLISTSFRTPPGAIDLLKKGLTRPVFAFDWAHATSDNPYTAFLGLADSIIVTGDSITMLAEACETEKPVYIFDLGEGRFSMRQDGSTPASGVKPGMDFDRMASAFRAFRKDLKVRAVNRFLPERLHRDTRPILRKLVESGAAAWLGDGHEPSTTWRSQVAADDVANRVLSLLQAGRNGGDDNSTVIHSRVAS